MALLESNRLFGGWSGFKAAELLELQFFNLIRAGVT